MEKITNFCHSLYEAHSPNLVFTNRWKSDCCPDVEAWGHIPEVVFRFLQQQIIAPVPGCHGDVHLSPQQAALARLHALRGLLAQPRAGGAHVGVQNFTVFRVHTILHHSAHLTWQNASLYLLERETNYLKQTKVYTLQC